MIVLTGAIPLAKVEVEFVEVDCFKLDFIGNNIIFGCCNSNDSSSSASSSASSCWLVNLDCFNLRVVAVEVIDFLFLMLLVVILLEVVELVIEESIVDESNEVLLLRRNVVAGIVIISGSGEDTWNSPKLVPIETLDANLDALGIGIITTINLTWLEFGLKLKKTTSNDSTF